MRADLAAKALPTLFDGLATGLMSGAAEKAVGGRDLYLHLSGRRSDGDGLYLHKSNSFIIPKIVGRQFKEFPIPRRVLRHVGSRMCGNKKSTFVSCKDFLETLHHL